MSCGARSARFAKEMARTGSGCATATGGLLLREECVDLFVRSCQRTAGALPEITASMAGFMMP